MLDISKELEERRKGEPCPICNRPMSLGRRDSRCPNCNSDFAILLALVNSGVRYYNEAFELAKKGELEDAIAKLQASIGVGTPEVDHYIFLGKLYAQQGNFDQAQRAFKQALDIEPNNKKAALLKQEMQDIINSSSNGKPILKITAVVASILVIAVTAGIFFWPRVSTLEKVRLALEKYPELAGVSAQESGEEIILSGEVYEDYKNAVLMLVQNVVSEKSVDPSDIHFKPHDYKALFMNKLMEHNPDLVERNLDVVQEENNLKITGEVHSFKEKAHIKALAESLDGIGEVDVTNVVVVHLVKERENLWIISKIHYDSHRYRQKIYEANKGIIKKQNEIYPGWKLVIPPL